MSERRCPMCRTVWPQWWRETFGSWGWCGWCGWKPEPRRKKQAQKYEPFTWVPS